MEFSLQDRPPRVGSGEDRTRRAGVGKPGATLPGPQSSPEGESAPSPRSRPKPSGSWHSRWRASGRAWLGGERSAVRCASPRGECRRTGCGEQVATGLLWRSLAAAGGASGNHVRVTPTPPFPAPDWRGRGEGAEAAVARAAAPVATRTPTPGPQALPGDGLPGEVRAWPKPESLTSRGAQPGFPSHPV